MRPQVWFNDYELTADYIVSDLERSLLPRNIGTTSVSGVDGELFTGVTLSSRQVKLTLTARADTPEDIWTASRRLAAVLNVSEPKKLLMSIDGGAYCYAIPTSDGDSDRHHKSESFDVTFTIPNPIYYGEHQSHDMTGGSPLTFRVGGNYPSPLKVTVTNARNGSNGFWRLRLDNGDYLYAKCQPGGSKLVFDCAHRILTVDGSVTLLVPDASWLELSPGTHTLTMTGTGNATIELDERWV